jgi:hypothetical protein
MRSAPLAVAVVLLMSGFAPVAAHAGTARAFVSQSAPTTSGAATFQAQTRPAQPFQGFNPEGGVQPFNPQGFSGFNPPVTTPPGTFAPFHHRVFVTPPPAVLIQSSSCWAPGYWGYLWFQDTYWSGHYQQVWVPERWVC